MKSIYEQLDKLKEQGASELMIECVETIITKKAIRAIYERWC